MRRLLLPLGALAAAALLLWGITAAIDAAGALSGTRIGATRTSVPGVRDVVLERGRHTLFYEVDESSVESDGSGDTEIEVPPLDVAIHRGREGPPLPLEGYDGSFDVTSGGRAATAVRSVTYRRRAATASAWRTASTPPPRPSYWGGRSSAACCGCS